MFVGDVHMLTQVHSSEWHHFFWLDCNLQFSFRWFQLVSYRTVSTWYKEKVSIWRFLLPPDSYRQLVEAVRNNALIYINNSRLIGSVHCCGIFHCVGWQQFLFVLINRSWLVPQSARTWWGGGERCKGDSSSFALSLASPKLFVLTQYEISGSKVRGLFRK